LAQIVEKFVKKGTQLYIEGKIRSRSYDDQNGVKRYITEIYADNVEMLNRRAGAGEGAGFQNDKHDTSYNDPVDLNDNSEADDLPF
jgi:single-strand DNA-binding protein